MKRNHVSLDKIRTSIVGLFAIAILTSAFFATPSIALAADPYQSCKGHLTQASQATDEHTKNVHLFMYKACVHDINVAKWNARHPVS
jgi:hypothetical protein